MTTKLGLWIDHRKALIVIISGQRGRSTTDHIKT